MANVSIKSGTTTFTFDDGECETVDTEKQGTLDENTLPASDSNNAFVIDVNGVKKQIMLNGYLYEAATTRIDTGTITSIADQITWLLALVNGTQAGYTFNSTYQTNKKVYCRRVKVTEKAGDPNRVSFSIELVEGL